MSILATAKTNIPSKVHYTEYIVTGNQPKMSYAYIVLMKAMVRVLHV
jgi:hypothetical protein